MGPAATLVWERGLMATEADSAGALDRRDVDRCLAGDEEAFERLMVRHQAAVGRLMWRFARHSDDQAELTQEVFITAWTHLRSWRGDGDLASWLRAIAVRQGYAYWRRQRREASFRVEPEDLELSLAPQAVLEQRQADQRADAAAAAGEQIHRLLARLSDRDRLVLTLLHLEELSVAEIAQSTGWSQSLVKVQAHRARARLRKLMEADHAAA